MAAREEQVTLDGSPLTSEVVPKWKQIAQARRALQQEQIPSEWRLRDNTLPTSTSSSETQDQSPASIVISSGILTKRELEITSIDSNSGSGGCGVAAPILSKIHSREWTALEVVTAFCKRAAILQQLTGCLTEIMFESALDHARNLDEHLKTTGQIIGPLHGLPLSLKDNHDIKGVDTSVGWVGLVGKPAAADAPAVEEYRKLGAVLYVKTNIPQSLMMSDSYNHVFGQSVNGLNRELISGGSSGGEGALVAAGGSVLGIGTDIGGSIRIPATLQGLYGLSPTTGRVGNRESIRTQKYMCLPVAGPLARHVEDVELFLSSYLSLKPWERDPGILDIPWRTELVDEVSQKRTKLRVGYIIDDGIVQPQPPVQRAVKETIDRFRSAGHEVVEWDAFDHKKAYDLWLRAVMADGGQRCRDLCTIIGEPLIPGMLVGKPENLLDNDQRQELADEIFDFQRSYLKRWNEGGLDALIMPVTQWVGMKPKVWVKSEMYVGYTSIWNLLNWTSLAVPATVVQKDLDRFEGDSKSYKGRSFSDQFNHDSYDVDLFDGMPVGVQIVTGRFGEEKAIGISKVLNSIPSRS